MALVDRTSIRRGGLAAIATAVFTALAVATLGPAWRQETGDPDGAPANTYHVFLLDSGDFTTIDPLVLAARSLRPPGSTTASRSWATTSMPAEHSTVFSGTRKAWSPRSIIRTPR